MKLFYVLIVAFTCLHYVHCRNVKRLSCDEIRQFVDGHNYRRQQLTKGEVTGQPAATEMNYMVWDEELASKAAKWASQNSKSHNPDKSIASGRFSTGENLYWYSTTKKNYKLKVDSALDNWFNEYKNYKFSPLTRSDFQKKGDKQIGHYTQMAWSETDRVGCAVGTSQNGRWNEYFVVCNYGPGGNYLGEVPYKSGRASNRLQCLGGNCNQPYGNKC